MIDDASCRSAFVYEKTLNDSFARQMTGEWGNKIKNNNNHKFHARRIFLVIHRLLFPESLLHTRVQKKDHRPP